MAAVKALRFNNCWVVDHTEMVKGDLVSGGKVISPFSLVQCLVVDLADSHWERHPSQHHAGSVAVWSPSPICHSPKKLHLSKKIQKWMAVTFLANTLYYIKWKDNTLNQLEAILHNRRIFQILKLFWASRDFDDSIKYTFKKMNFLLDREMWKTNYFEF